MDTGDLLPEGPAPGKQAAATERGEHWWPVGVAILVTGALHLALPATYRVNPRWVVPVVLFVLLAVLIIGDPGRIDRSMAWRGSWAGAAQRTSLDSLLGSARRGRIGR